MRLVVLLNLAYFGIEFAVALVIGSVSLFADSIDFLEDTDVNGLILLALGWNAPRRTRVGMALARASRVGCAGRAGSGEGARTGPLAASPAYAVTHSRIWPRVGPQILCAASYTLPSVAFGKRQQP